MEKIKKEHTNKFCPHNLREAFAMGAAVFIGVKWAKNDQNQEKSFDCPFGRAQG